MFNICLDLNSRFVGLYNTLHDSAALIEKNTYNDLLNFRFEEDGTVDLLLNEKILIEESFNEAMYFRYFINKLKYSPSYINFTLLLTSNCNYSCEYCFEGFEKNHKHMTERIASEFITYIKRVLTNHSSVRKILIVFYGGEPLLNKKIMKFICNLIEENGEIRDKVDYSITTNLSLLTDQDIDFFVYHNFNSIQVALDGSRSIHDKRRNKKNGDRTFDLTMKNIQKLTKQDLPVIVILNFDKVNFDSFDQLISEIKSSIDYKKIEFVLNPITQTMGNKNCKKIFMEENEEVSIYLDLYNKLIDNGLNINSLSPKNMLCMATKDVAALIVPNGDIYKCGLMMNDETKKIGTIFNENYNSNFYEMITDTPWEVCLEERCKYLPVCGGGCIGLNFVKNKSTSSIHCEKETYFDRLYTYFLTEQFREQMVNFT